MSELVFDVGLAAKLKLAFARNGWTPELIDKLCEGGTLSDFRDVLLGHAEVKMFEPIIDLNATPFIPTKWSVGQHKQGGSFRWNPHAVQLYLSESQCNGKSIEGGKLYKELEVKPIFNANLLDFLLKHPNLIPEEWKQNEKGHSRYIFFWGTLYRHSDGGVCVRCLYWDGSKWQCGSRWIAYNWDMSFPAALYRS